MPLPSLAHRLIQRYPRLPEKLVGEGSEPEVLAGEFFGSPATLELKNEGSLMLEVSSFSKDLACLTRRLQ
jgi:hypothetical protein